MQESGQRLLILAYIQAENGFRLLQPGDIVPGEEFQEANAWVAAGSARFVSDDYTPPVYQSARAVTAEAGLPGMATGGDGGTFGLVGRVPLTQERARGNGIQGNCPCGH